MWLLCVWGSARCSARGSYNWVWSHDHAPTATQRLLSDVAVAFRSKATTPLDMLAPTTRRSSLVDTADPVPFRKETVQGAQCV